MGSHQLDCWAFIKLAPKSYWAYSPLLNNKQIPIDQKSSCAKLKNSIVVNGKDDRCTIAKAKGTRAGRARRSCISGEVQQQWWVHLELRQGPYHPAMESSPWNSHQNLQSSRPWSPRCPRHSVAFFSLSFSSSLLIFFQYLYVVTRLGISIIYKLSFELLILLNIFLIKVSLTVQKAI